MTIANAFAELPRTHINGGIETELGTLLPPGGKVAAYVRSGGVVDGDHPDIAARLVSTLNAGLAYCRSGKGDIVVVLPGHSESVSTATALSNLVAGTTILGFGKGSMQPVFRWTATAAQWALSKADVTIRGLYLRLEGADGVVKAINVTGADVSIEGCRIQAGSGASNKAAIAIEVGTGADRFAFVGNKVNGVVAGAVVDFLKIVAAVIDCTVAGNDIDVATTVAAVGPIDVTAAALGLRIVGNVIRNSDASSTAAITLGNVACSGSIANNRLFAMGASAAPATTIIVLGAANIMRFAENYGCSEDDLSGVLCPAAT